MNVFHWHKRGQRRPIQPGMKIPLEKEGLKGFVHGKQASDIEERMYIAFLHNGVPDDDIEYQPSYVMGRNLPGEIRPDFAVFLGLMTLWFADGDYWHKTAEQTQRDDWNDQILFQRLEGRAEYPIRIPGEDLADQDTADRVIGEHLG